MNISVTSHEVTQLNVNVHDVPSRSSVKVVCELLGKCEVILFSGAVASVAQLSL